jgi:hypothetical protein
MLFYLNFSLFFIIVLNFKFTYDIFIKIYTRQEELKHNFGYILFYLADLFCFGVTSLFFKMHLTLVLQNKTTIETIERKGIVFESEFDQGYYNNWIQVMGGNIFLWFLPIKLYIGLARGNGIDWYK